MVHPPQAKSLFHALKDGASESQLAIYSRSGHIFTHKESIKDSLERNVAWFERWLK
ncbi:MAG: prolyl oligopeptidase family serine peptidase [Candidatus Margulisbacteria bacterium]|nr:prolyl oligopeptidase family serine peptidase [Candidatus Margulisiibacteriota bacterium]